MMCENIANHIHHNINLQRQNQSSVCTIQENGLTNATTSYFARATVKLMIVTVWVAAIPNPKPSPRRHQPFRFFYNVA
jgi:hypothetical protein